MSQRNTRTIAIIALAVFGPALALSGCSQKYSAERDGKDLGQAICDLRDATDAEEADKALSDIEAELEDLENEYAFYTAEDRADVQNNLADLYEHAIQGNEALMHQDLAVLDRSADNIAEDSGEVAQAVWDGLRQGLSDCIG